MIKVKGLAFSAIVALTTSLLSSDCLAEITIAIPKETDPSSSFNVEEVPHEAKEPPIEKVEWKIKNIAIEKNGNVLVENKKRSLHGDHHTHDELPLCSSVADSNDRFSIGIGDKNTEKTVSCSWVARKSTKSRCKIQIVQEQCPVTCGNCIQQDPQDVKVPEESPTKQRTLPTPKPTESPTPKPTEPPTPTPTSFPTQNPTALPSTTPTETLTFKPSLAPSDLPSGLPTNQLSTKPSSSPTETPTSTSNPTSPPSEQPSTIPSSSPTEAPTYGPSSSPSSQPSASPTNPPSVLPSLQPTLPMCFEISDTKGRFPIEGSKSSKNRKSKNRKSDNGIKRKYVSCDWVARRDTMNRCEIQVVLEKCPVTCGACNDVEPPSAPPSVQPSAKPSNIPSIVPSIQSSDSPSQSPTTTQTSSPSNPPVMLPFCVDVSDSEERFILSDTRPDLVSCDWVGRKKIKERCGYEIAKEKCPITCAQCIPSPSSQPSSLPSASPTSEPTSTPSKKPSDSPSNLPTNSPTGDPSAEPSHQPTASPSSEPTDQPSISPTSEPTSTPSKKPSSSPSNLPTNSPSGKPSAEPSHQPTASPSSEPTDQPSISPSVSPSAEPTEAFSSEPSIQPTSSPSNPSVCVNTPNWVVPNRKEFPLPEGMIGLNCDELEALSSPPVHDKFCDSISTSAVPDEMFALDACCFCGGGEYVELQCKDVEDWTMNEKFNCKDIEQIPNPQPLCDVVGDHLFNNISITAAEACCSCGGGENVLPPEHAT